MDIQQRHLLGSLLSYKDLSLDRDVLLIPAECDELCCPGESFGQIHVPLGIADRSRTVLAEDSIAGLAETPGRPSAYHLSDMSDASSHVAFEPFEIPN